MKQKKILAGKILKTSPGKIRIAPGAEGDVVKAITRSDMRGLIAVGKIYEVAHSEQSRGRARHIMEQKKKGRRSGRGTKKGKKYAIVPRKEQWMARIRVQRKFLAEIKEKGLVSKESYKNLYAKSKGGYFRNRRHIKLYITEHDLFLTPEGKKLPVGEESTAKKSAAKKSAKTAAK